jgi:hypothetical protein
VNIIDPKDVAEYYFGEGARQAEIDESEGKQTPCPHCENTAERHWWARGYSYFFRLVRALKAERTARELTLRAADLESQFGAYKVDLHAAPCIFCGYNGPNYFQAGTHAMSCPWREVGGATAREQLYPKVIEGLRRSIDIAHEQIIERDKRITELAVQTNDKLSQLATSNVLLDVKNESADEALKRYAEQLSKCERKLAASRKQLEAFARDLALALDIPYESPVAEGQCAYLAAVNSLKERVTALENEKAQRK